MVFCATSMASRFRIKSFSSPTASITLSASHSFSISFSSWCSNSASLTTCSRLARLSPRSILLNMGYQSLMQLPVGVATNLALQVTSKLNQSLLSIEHHYVILLFNSVPVLLLNYQQVKFTPKQECTSYNEELYWGQMPLSDPFSMLPWLIWKNSWKRFRDGGHAGCNSNTVTLYAGVRRLPIIQWSISRNRLQILFSHCFRLLSLFKETILWKKCHYLATNI